MGVTADDDTKDLGVGDTQAMKVEEEEKGKEEDEPRQRNHESTY